LKGIKFFHLFPGNRSIEMPDHYIMSCLCILAN
jgi:hypothetical protein